MQYLVPGKVPEPYRQRFEYHPESIDLSFPAYSGEQAKTGCSSKFLYRSTGELTSFVATWYNHSLEIFCRATKTGCGQFSFEPGCTIQDVDLLPSEGGGFGLFVTVHTKSASEGPAFVALLHETVRGSRLDIVEKLLIPNEITSARVLICDEAMKKTTGLNKKMRDWVHMFVIGTTNAHCYIGSFSSSSASRETVDGSDVGRRVKLTDGLKPFHSSDGKLFAYKAKDEMGVSRVSRQFPTESVEVTALEFMARGNLLVIGLSFGGIITVSLGAETTISQWIYPCSAPLRHLTYMVPDDDPHGDLWFWAAYDVRKNPASSVTGLSLYLYCVAPSRVEGEEETPPDQRSFSDPNIVPRFQHTIAVGVKWVSVRTLVRERERVDPDATSSSNRSKSGFLECDKSSLLLTYKDKDDNLMGSLFDLNAYYYKRLVGSVTADGTAALQNPFLSVIWPMLNAPKNISQQVIQDVAVDASLMRRFISNISVAEQLFYPSAVDLTKAFMCGTHSVFGVTVKSVGSKMLSYIAENPNKHLLNPRDAADWSRALGLISVHHTLSEHTQKELDFGTLMTVLVSYHCTEWLINCELMQDVQFVMKVDSWLWSEIERAKQKMDDTIHPLFSRLSKPLTGEGARTLDYARTVFQGACEMLPPMLRVLKSSREVDEAVLKTKDAQLAAATNLFHFASCVARLIENGMLPLPDDSNEKLFTLKQTLARRRKEADKKGQKLYIDRVISKMQRLCQDEPFWLGQEPEQWYPPALHNLLAPTMVIPLSLRSKQQLLIYYMLDYLSVNRAAVDKTRLSWEVGCIVIHTFGIWPADIDIVYKEWHNDSMSETESSGSSPVVASAPVDENAERVRVLSEVERLVSMAGKLSVREEGELRELLARIPTGKYKWQVYLMRAGRYKEIEELPIPTDNDDQYITEYLQILPIIPRKDCISPLPTVTEFSFDFTQNLANACSNYMKDNEKNIPPSILFNKRTPLGVCRKLGLNVSAARASRKRPAVAVCADVSSQVATPPMPKRPVQLDETPEQISQSSESNAALRRISEVLHTPKSRAKAAAAAEAHLDLTLDTTPDTAINLPMPSSILKSAAKSHGAKSPQRPKLRFALPDDSQISISSTPDKVPQPVFSDSDSEDDIENPDGTLDVEDESAVSTRMECQEEEEDSNSQQTDAPSTSSDSCAAAPSASDTFVVYRDDKSSESTAPTETPEKLADTDASEKKTGGPLVDYSFNDSTICHTPDRSIARTGAVQGEILHRSFEQQPEEESETDENTTKEAEKSVAAQDEILVRSFEEQPDIDSETDENAAKVQEEEKPVAKSVHDDILIRSFEEQPDEETDNGEHTDVTETRDVETSSTSVVAIASGTGVGSTAAAMAASIRTATSDSNESVEIVEVQHQEVTADHVTTTTMTARTTTWVVGAEQLDSSKEASPVKDRQVPAAISPRKDDAEVAVQEGDNKNDPTAQIPVAKESVEDKETATVSGSKVAQPTPKKGRTRTASVTLAPETPTRHSSRLMARASSVAPTPTPVQKTPTRSVKKKLFVASRDDIVDEPTPAASRSRRSTSRSRVNSVSAASDTDGSNVMPVPKSPSRKSTRTVTKTVTTSDSEPVNPPKSPARRTPSRRRQVSESAESSDASVSTQGGRRRRPIGPDGKELRGSALFDHVVKEKERKKAGTSTTSRTRTTSDSAAVTKPAARRRSAARNAYETIQEESVVADTQQETRRTSRSRSSSRCVDGGIKTGDVPSTSSVSRSVGRKRQMPAAEGGGSSGEVPAPATPKRGRPRKVSSSSEADTLAIQKPVVSVPVPRPSSSRKQRAVPSEERVVITVSRYSSRSQTPTREALAQGPVDDSVPPTVTRSSSRRRPVVVVPEAEPARRTRTTSASVTSTTATPNKRPASTRKQK